MVPLSLERREPPKITGSGGSSLAVQLGFLLQLLLILSVVLTGRIRLLLVFASLLLLLVALFSDLLKQVLTLLFGLLSRERGEGSSMDVRGSHMLQL